MILYALAIACILWLYVHLCVHLPLPPFDNNGTVPFALSGLAGVLIGTLKYHDVRIGLVISLVAETAFTLRGLLDVLVDLCKTVALRSSRR